LILLNIFPIIGVLLFNWEVFPILLLYGIESLISLFFDNFTHSSESASMSGIFKYSSYFWWIMTFLIFQAGLLTVIFSIIDQKHALSTIWNAYFGITVFIFIVDKLRLRITNRRTKYKNRSLDKRMTIFFGKQVLLVLIAVCIILTKAQVPGLILIIVIKLFLDIRLTDHQSICNTTH